MNVITPPGPTLQKRTCSFPAARIYMYIWAAELFIWYITQLTGCSYLVLRHSPSYYDTHMHTYTHTHIYIIINIYNIHKYHKIILYVYCCTVPFYGQKMLKVTLVRSPIRSRGHPMPWHLEKSYAREGSRVPVGCSRCLAESRLKRPRGPCGRWRAGDA